MQLQVRDGVNIRSRPDWEMIGQLLIIQNSLVENSYGGNYDEFSSVLKSFVTSVFVFVVVFYVFVFVFDDINLPIFCAPHPCVIRGQTVGARCWIINIYMISTSR